MGNQTDPKPLHLESVDSTNTWMLLHGQGLPDWAVVYTLNQTHGRGRRERAWKSNAGETLAMSLRVPPLPHDVPPSWIPLIAGLSLIRVLKDLGLDSARLKWPNDVLVSSRKLSGTLVEVALDGSLIVGVGINVLSPVEHLPDPQATSLVAEGLEVDYAIESVVVEYRDALRRLIGDGLACAPKNRIGFWLERVTESLATIGSLVEVIGDDGVTIQGTAQKLGPSGELIVKTDDGHTLDVHAGDIFHISRS